MAADAVTPNVDAVEDVVPPEKSQPEPLRRDETTEKRIRRAFDLRVLPMGTFIYLLSFIDRTNMGNAKILGIVEDNNLTGNRYNVTLTVFYVSYIIFEIPSNMACKHFGPKIWLAFITFGFGITTFATAFVSSFPVLVFLRFPLGAFEAGIQPGIMYSYTQFYRRHELVGRWGIKAAMASVAGSFGGLLAAGLGSIPASGMMHKWRWIFLLEGVLTAAWGVVVFFMLPNSCAEAKFLSPEDRAYAETRIVEEVMVRGDDPIRKDTFKKALFNINIHLTALATCSSLLCLTSLSFFMPTVLRNMGYSSIHAQLMSVPPYTVSAIVCICLSMVSDRIKRRGVILTAISPIVPIGFAILATVQTAGVRYFAIFLTTSGAYVLSPMLLAWGVENSAGPAVRAITAAYLVGFASIGAMIATWGFLEKDAPRYLPGQWTNFGFGLLSTVTIPILIFHLKKENKARAEGKRDHRLLMRPEEVNGLGHLHPAFRYTT